MSKHAVRSTVFNICFMIATAISCIIFLPTLLLPRRYYLATVRSYLSIVRFFERHVMGLTFEIRGLENLPKSGPFLVAAKHQSLFETFKLHFIFDDPAIILKKELLYLPVWGLYLKKSDVIAIDRSTPERALKSIEEGALRMKEQSRPVVIFPQGTRVRPHETPQDKPYKAGIARIQEATNLPVIPLALNSGSYWPKRSWLKSPGTVVFQFLEPIAPGAMDRKALMETLERKLESASNDLSAEAEKKKSSAPARKKIGIAAKLFLLATAFILYSGWWFVVAERAASIYTAFLQDVMPARSFSPPEITGFPGKIKFHVPADYIETAEGTLRVENLRAQSWPFPFLPAHISADKIEIKSVQWKESLAFTDFSADLLIGLNKLTIRESRLLRDNFEGGATGSIDFSQQPTPKFDIVLTMKNHQEFLESLSAIEIIKPESAMLMGFALSAFAVDGVVTVPVTQKSRTLFAGPLPIAALPDPHQTTLAPRRIRPDQGQ